MSMHVGFRRVTGSVATLALLAMPALLCSQPGQLAAKDDLKRAFDENKDERDKYFSGDIEVKKGDDKAKKIARASAQWYIYRTTIKWAKADDMEVVHTQFNRRVTEIIEAKKNGKNNTAFRELFAQEVIKALGEVFHDRDITADPSVVTNTAMMLPTLGRLNTEDVGKYLVAMINDKTKHDVLRLYAIKAMRELLPVTPQANVPVLVDVKKAERDTKIVEPLAQFITQKVNGTSAQQDAVIRYLRREAVISLAQADSPAVVAFDKKIAGKDIKPLQGEIAPALLAVLANRVEPAASTQERIEAAVGLCTMKHQDMPEYNPDLATYLMGQLVIEMVKEYRTDSGNFAAGGAKKVPSRIAWKTEAKRLATNFAQWKDLTKNTSGAPAASELEARTREMFKKIALYDNPVDDDLDRLRAWLATIRPKTGAVFKSVSSATIELPKAK